MTKTCFQLQHLNLPESVRTTIQDAATNGEFCHCDEFYDRSMDYLPYADPFGRLGLADYMKVQSEFLKRNLIRFVHSPDQVRFALEGMRAYIADSDKRRRLIAELESRKHFPGDPPPLRVDELKCSWDKSLFAPRWRSDDTLVSMTLEGKLETRCEDRNKNVWLSLAHYYGWDDTQVTALPLPSLELLDALMSDGSRSPEQAVRLYKEVLNIPVYYEARLFIPLLGLESYGLSLLDIIKRKDRINDFYYWEPLFYELRRLNIPDALTLVQKIPRRAEVLGALGTMAGLGYSEDEQRRLVSYAPYLYLDNLSAFFTLGRRNDVPFEELCWLLEDTSVMKTTWQDKTIRIDEVINAYLNHPRRSRQAAYEVVSDLWNTFFFRGFLTDQGRPISQDRLYKVLADHTVPNKDRLHAVHYLSVSDNPRILFQLVELLQVPPRLITKEDLPHSIGAGLDPELCELWHESYWDLSDKFIQKVASSLAQRLGIGLDQADFLLKNPEPALWEFVFTHKAESFQFNERYLGDYGRIAKAMHNKGWQLAMSVWNKIAFDDYIRESPPKTLVDAAQMTQKLAAVDVHLAKHYIMKVVIFFWTRIQKSHEAWLNPKTRRLDVTRHTIKDVNSILALYEHMENFGVGDPYETECFMQQLDVEEVDVQHLPMEGYADYFELIKYLQKGPTKASGDYLARRLLDMDPRGLFGDNTLAMDAIERVRVQSNERYPHLGDELVDNLGITVLNGIGSDVTDIPMLLKIARHWGLQDTSVNIPRDGQGLYRQYAFFAYQTIHDIVMRKTGGYRNGGEVDAFGDDLSHLGLSRDALIAELEAKGFSVRSESNGAKAASRIWTNPGYVIQRGVQKVFSGGSREENLSNLTVSEATDWPARTGVSVQVIANAAGKEVARAIQCDPAIIGVEILLNKYALVDTERRKAALGKHYVFSAPLNMTTTDTRTMTEIAYDHGEPMNWLMSIRGKDGLLLVGKNRSPMILDKRAIRLGDMIEDRDMSAPAMKEAMAAWKRRRKLEDMSHEEILNANISPFYHLTDKLFFRAIMKCKSYSLLSGMLFTADSNDHRLKDKTASRRLFVEYADGRFGVVDGTEYLTTEEAFEAAKAAGATKAIYMDTGFWDQADYVDGQGKSHRMDPGYSNSSASTNRVIIRVK